MNFVREAVQLATGMRLSIEGNKMRSVAAALIVLAGTSVAQADIRINESRYVEGTLIVSGETSPNRTVTLDNTYTTTSDDGGDFTFKVKNYKPSLCMSDIRSGNDIYSAVIAGCLDSADRETPLPPTASPAKGHQL